jgi:PKD repeat protein
LTQRLIVENRLARIDFNLKIKRKLQSILSTYKLFQMKKIILFLVSFLTINLAYSQGYSRVKINTSNEGLKALSDLGVTVDHGIRKDNTFFISDFSAHEIALMQANNFSIEVLIPDVQAYYIQQNETTNSTYKNTTCQQTTSITTPTHFNQGSMGGYLTYTQLLAELDEMATLYPNLITTKMPISTFLTIENRPIYHVRISDNPSLDEAGEPKVLYTSLHHAREPMSLMETVFYMWFLLENYATNEEVQYLLNNMQLYFVPCINPDGYVYNNTTNPNGGGMHRKNRRNVGTTNKGVDLNRNYSYGWGTTGTSTNVNNDTYPGTGAFSEAETQAMRWLVQNNHFITAFNAHTWAKSILFPIGTTNAEFAPHHDYLQAETNHMVENNGYTAMKSSILYQASGDSDDYMYKVDIGVGQKDTIFAHTPEVGTAFWQPASEIDATCKEMLHPNLVLAHLTKKYIVAKDIDPSFIPSTSGNFNHSAHRLGLESGSVVVSIEPLLNVATVGNPITYNLILNQQTTSAISYTLVNGIQTGATVKYILKTDNGLWIKRDTIVKVYGSYNLIASETGVTTNWIGNWNTTSAVFYSPSQSYTDSPTGNYTSNSTKTYTYSPSINLTTVTDAKITYYAKWDIEADFDYVQFQVSTDGGSTWIPQFTKYTVAGTSANGSVQPDNSPVYEGQNSNWVLDEVSLSEYVGQSIKVRFVLKSDGGTNGDGFYFDDFKVYSLNSNQVIAPVAQFTASSVEICAGQSISLTDGSINNPTTWLWNFGDGTTETVQSPSHTFANAGSFTIQLTASNSAGSTSFSLPITVNDCSSINEVLLNKVKLIPNPNQGEFRLVGTELGATYRITDFLGKEIYSATTNAGITLVSLGNVSAGMYFIELKKENSTKQLKFTLID